MQKPIEPKKILCIHDLSGVGRCSLAVILPVLSVMGFQPVALPTVVLSTHTGGLGTPARMDGSAYGMAALEHYQELELQFDCIYTGYLGGEAQVALAEKAFALWPAAYKVVDPVMGDNGKAYSTVTPALVERIRSLCRAADLILPNYTEAQLLLQQRRGFWLPFLRPALWSGRLLQRSAPPLLWLSPWPPLSCRRAAQAAYRRCLRRSAPAGCPQFYPLTPAAPAAPAFSQLLPPSSAS